MFLAGVGYASDPALGPLFRTLPWALGPSLHGGVGRWVSADRIVFATSIHACRALPQHPKVGSRRGHQCPEGGPHGPRDVLFSVRGIRRESLRTIFQSGSETAIEAGLTDFLLIAPIVLLGSFAVAWSVATLIYTVRETPSTKSDGQTGLSDRARAAIALGIVVTALAGLTFAAGYREALLKEADSTQIGEDLENLYARVWVQHDKAILRAIAQNPNTTRLLFERLSAEEDISVRMQVAGNPQTPRTILRKMHYTRKLDSALALNFEHTSGNP